MISLSMNSLNITKFLYRNKLYFIVFGTLIVYYPAFSCFFQPGDAYDYYLRTQNYSLWDLLTKHVFNNKAHLDCLLYRPLALSMLGLEKFFFGSQYVLWLWFSLFFHLGVVLWLYKILAHIKKDILAVLLSALFAVNSMFIHAIVRVHPSAYLLCLMLVLISLYRLYDYTFNGKRSLINIVSICTCMLFACFMNETVVGFCVLFVIFGIFYDLQKNGSIQKIDFSYLWIMLPALIYLSSYYVYKISGSESFMLFKAGQIFSLQNITDMATAFPKAFFTWLMLGSFGRPTPLKCAAFAFSVIYIIWCVYLSRQWVRRNMPFIVLITMMIMSHIIGLSFYRRGTYGLSSAITIGNHSIYLFWPYLMILLYTLIDFDVLKVRHRTLWYFWVVGVTLFIIINAAVTYKSTTILSNNARPKRLYIDQLNRFVKSHQREKNFSFFAVAPASWNEDFNIGYVDNDGTVQKKTLTQIPLPQVFFGEYYTRKDPKYIVRYDETTNKLYPPS